MYKITVLGGGYVGLSLAMMLAGNNKVVIVDNDKGKVECINRLESPIRDELIVSRFNTMKKKGDSINLVATENLKVGTIDADAIIIALPTNLNEITGTLDCSLIEEVVVEIAKETIAPIIVIKSTVTIGYTAELQKKYHLTRLLYSPEFLRETHGLHDCLNPSRIVIGLDCSDTVMQRSAEWFSELLKDNAEKENIVTLFMSYGEAEAVKLFSNAYLAMRVSFFNELSNLAITKKLNPQKIIEGVCTDSRIGNYYNNPSFGFGGYCLPKDIRQLLSNFENIPHSLLKAIVRSNVDRKDYIVSEITKRLSLFSKEKSKVTIGVFRLTMKKESDNWRKSATIEVANSLVEKGFCVLVYEPLLQNAVFSQYKITTNLRSFKAQSDLIVANRLDACLEDVESKLFTCDVFHRD